MPTLDPGLAEPVLEADLGDSGVVAGQECASKVVYDVQTRLLYLSLPLLRAPIFGSIRISRQLLELAFSEMAHRPEAYSPSKRWQGILNKISYLGGRRAK